MQYQLTPNLAAMIAYVGSRGVHQPFRVDEADLVIPTKTSAGYLWPQVDANGNLTSGPNRQGYPPSSDQPGLWLDSVQCFIKDAHTLMPSNCN